MTEKCVIQRAKPEESHTREKARFVRDISLSLNMTKKCVIQRTKPTMPRTKRVHSNSNRKNTFSDYEFSIFTLCSACRRISYKPKLSFRAVGEESQAREKARPVRDISLSLKMTYKPSFRGHSPKNLIQDTKQDLLEIFRFRSI